jgi:hypothetical protein
VHWVLLARRGHLGSHRGIDAGRRGSLVTLNKSIRRMIAISLAWVFAFVVQMTTVCVLRARGVGPEAGATAILRRRLELELPDPGREPPRRFYSFRRSDRDFLWNLELLEHLT